MGMPDISTDYFTAYILLNVGNQLGRKLKENKVAPLGVQG